MTGRKGYSTVLYCERGWNYMREVEVFPQIFEIAEGSKLNGITKLRKFNVKFEGGSIIKRRMGWGWRGGGGLIYFSRCL